MSHQRNTNPECGCLWPSVPIGCPRKLGWAEPYVRIRLLFDPRVLAWVTLHLFSFPRGKVWIACSDRHHSQRGGPRVWEWPGERGGRRGGKNEETQTQNYPDQEAGVLARPLKLNWHPDEEVFWIILTRRNLLLWKWPVTTLEVAACDCCGRNSVLLRRESRLCLLVLTTLRISQCSWLLGMSWANHWVWGDRTRTSGNVSRKPITIVFCTCSFLVGSVFARGRLISGSRESLLFLTSLQGRLSVPVGKGTTWSHKVSGAERLWRQQCNVETVVSHFSPSRSNVCACVLLIFRTNLWSYIELRHCCFPSLGKIGKHLQNLSPFQIQWLSLQQHTWWGILPVIHPLSILFDAT